MNKLHDELTAQRAALGELAGQVEQRIGYCMEYQLTQLALVESKLAELEGKYDGMSLAKRNRLESDQTYHVASAQAYIEAIRIFRDV